MSQDQEKSLNQSAQKKIFIQKFFKTDRLWKLIHYFENR